MGDETPGKLDGLTIAVTREEAGELAKLLAHEGARVLHFPLIQVQPTGGDWIEQAKEREWDWLVFTSTNAVTATGKGVTANNVACVGDVTAKEAARLKYEVNLLPERQHVKGLIEAFAALERPTGHVLYPRSELAASTLKEGLQALGFQVDDPVAYRTLPDDEGKQALAEQRGLQAIVFASPSAVRNAVDCLGVRLSGLAIYSIGPTTSHAVREAGFEVASEAHEHSTNGLLQAILKKESKA